MKKSFFTILLVSLFTLTFAQENETSLKKEIVSMDIGFLGAWISYERYLDGLLSIKSEVGLEGGFGMSSSVEVDNYFIFIPTLRAEPRYYYNFSRRVNLQKKTSFNAANYFAMSVTYISDLFIVSNVSGFTIEKGLSIIPKWGMQRTIGKRGSFQLSLGAGPFFNSTKTVIIPGIDLRIGYHFK